MESEQLKQRNHSLSNTQQASNFCPQCGQPKKSHDNYVCDFRHENGFWVPGNSFTQVPQATKPVRYLIICSSKACKMSFEIATEIESRYDGLDLIYCPACGSTLSYQKGLVVK